MAGAYAKILLFGEHIVLQGAEALAMPWMAFQGQWAQKTGAVQQALPQFADYLQEMQDRSALLASLDLTALRNDLQKGWYFDSDIPTGYGAGSSGALCAALYKKYQTATPPTNLILLREQLAQLESFFHGSSSGTDPLICYLNQAIHIVPGQGIRAFDWNWQDYPDLHFFVINTGIQRQTGPWVAAFKAKASQETFSKEMQETLIPASNAAIQALLQRETSALADSYRQISDFQYQHLRDWIPEAFHSVWKTGLDSGDYHLKLCGAGGGGFILGLANNSVAISRLKNHHEVLSLH